MRPTFIAVVLSLTAGCVADTRGLEPGLEAPPDAGPTRPPPRTNIRCADVLSPRQLADRPFFHADFAPGGRLLAYLETGGFLKVFDTEKEQIIFEDDGITAAVFNAAGTGLVVLGASELSAIVRVVSLIDNTAGFEVTLASDACKVLLSPDRQRLVLVDQCGRRSDTVPIPKASLRAFDISDPLAIGSDQLAHESSFERPYISRDSTRVAFTRNYREIRCGEDDRQSIGELVELDLTSPRSGPRSVESDASFSVLGYNEQNQLLASTVPQCAPQARRVTLYDADQRFELSSGRAIDDPPFVIPGRFLPLWGDRRYSAALGLRGVAVDDAQAFETTDLTINYVPYDRGPTKEMTGSAQLEFSRTPRYALAGPPQNEHLIYVDSSLQLVIESTLVPRGDPTVLGSTESTFMISPDRLNLAVTTFEGVTVGPIGGRSTKIDRPGARLLGFTPDSAGLVFTAEGGIFFILANGAEPVLRIDDFEGDTNSFTVDDGACLIAYNTLSGAGVAPLAALGPRPD